MSTDNKIKFTGQKQLNLDLKFGQKQDDSKWTPFHTLYTDVVNYCRLYSH